MCQNIQTANTKYTKFCNKIDSFNTMLRDYLVKNAFYSLDEFLSGGHNDMVI
jgi:hypothetical protein